VPVHQVDSRVVAARVLGDRFPDNANVGASIPRSEPIEMGDWPAPSSSDFTCQQAAPHDIHRACAARDVGTSLREHEAGGLVTPRRTDRLGGPCRPREMARWSPKG
jgi:hypothetical protein